MTGSGDETTRRARLTVQGWFASLLGVVVLLVVLGASVGSWSLQRTADVSDQLAEHLQPARTEAYRLQNALVDQETGVRGYVLAADRRFLEPFEEGVRVEAEAAGRLRELLAGRDSLLADLDAIEDAARQWRERYARPAVDAVVPGVPGVVDSAAPERGKEDFDRLRGLFAQQDRRLVQARDDGRADLAAARFTRNGILAVWAVGLLLACAAIAVVVRRLIVRPLAKLRAATRTVADGDFESTIPAHGPADLRSVALDVDRMRGRIVEALDASRGNEERLQEQAAALDARAEELRRSNAELEQFAYVASHDLQEPLRKVASFCQLLEKRYRDRLDDRGVQYLDFAVDGAKRMQVLINDLLTFSRVGRVTGGRREKVALGDALDTAVQNLATAIEESGAAVQRPAELPVLTTDPTLLTMLWQNLLGNAVKFRHPDRAPVVTVTCDREDPADGPPRWLLTVTDNGIGISPEFADKVFVIFQRLHGRDDYPGTGIGLALCKKIVEHLGGAIGVDTTHRGGARVWFTVPVPEDQA
ncbi:CHASE3 domain-containing protein [Actinosynnema sp. NPDC020468]|uniref:sensor histidine kinase n=1 Tax=Actinosynnema sp. NPDC020468 TaxID=3154488 RepID=UPI0033ED16D9